MTALRERLGLSQAEFARQFMLNLRTLQDWEQGRREPEDIARIYLRVIERNPDAVRAALGGLGAGSQCAPHPPAGAGPSLSPLAKRERVRAKCLCRSLA